MMICGDARALPLRDRCVQTVVTSPPYWGLRDYGDRRQIGLERTPADYVAHLVAVFRELWRVLRDDGTAWLNLGDCYATGAGRVGDCPGGGEQGDRWKGYRGVQPVQTKDRTGGKRHDLKAVGPMTQPNRMPIEGLQPKDLVGIPWRVAFALQADGWRLRSDVIWSKPNPMPESVTDRPTRSHEYVFLLSKRARYYYAAAAIAEPAIAGSRAGNKKRDIPSDRDGRGIVNDHRGRGAPWSDDGNGRNKRSVWTVATAPYAGAHFATFPPALIEPCILAGAPIGAIVLDPFMGSGTTGAVCERLSRRWVGVDLAYFDQSRERTAQRGLRFAAPLKETPDRQPATV